MLPDPKYNPSNSGGITSGTKLGPGITMAKFLGARGSRTNLEKHDEVFSDRLQLANNLYLHAEAMQTIYNNFEFSEYRLTVSDGVYTPVGNEKPKGINDSRIRGEAIGYQLVNKLGKVDSSKSYDLAVYWKDYIDYEKIILDYDTFDPSGDLVTTIFLVMPSVPVGDSGTGFRALNPSSYLRNLETYYNGKLQSKDELLEILI